MIDTGITVRNINVHENLRKKKSQANTLKEVATGREKVLYTSSMNVIAASRYPAKSKYSFTAQLRSFRSLSFRGPNAEIFVSHLSCWLVDPSRIEAPKRSPVYRMYESCQANQWPN